MSTELQPQDLPVATHVEREMTVQELSAQSLKIHHILNAVMVDGIHYGKIPGTDKPTLYQAGAEKICATFRLAPRYEVDDLSEPLNNLYRYRAKCLLYTIRDGLFVGSAMGEASSAEEKYQWEKAVCQQHWETTDPTRRRVKFQRTRDNSDGYIEILQVQRNCADLANTVLKIACKRAFTSATKGATAASDLLDVDLDEEVVQELKKAETKDTLKPKAKAAPAPKLAFGRSKGKAIDDPSVPVDDLQWMRKYIADNIGNEKRKQYEKQDQKMLELLDAELAKRQAVSIPLDDATWLELCTEWLKDQEASYVEACLKFKVDDGTRLPADQRQRFYALMTTT